MSSKSSEQFKMPGPRVSEIWMLTKEGKILPRPDRKCPKCYESGQLVKVFITRMHAAYPRIYVTRRCKNQNCPYFEETWFYFRQGREFPMQELVEIKKWVLKQNESSPELLRKLDELIEFKLGRKSHARMPKA
jgi:hypothetical protein